MAHQLDFHVTLWSDNQEALLKLERLLNSINTLELPDEVYGMSITQQDKTKCKLNALAGSISGFGNVDFGTTLHDVDIHSVDINWDDEDEDDTTTS